MERAKAKFQGRILSKFYIIQRVTRVELWIFAGCRFPWNSQSIFEGIILDAQIVVEHMLF